jgi:hypothetical protein
MPSVAYAVHTRACTYLLDEEGICRWVLSRRGTATDDRCVGAQFVACVDTSVEGGLVGELRPGSSALFVGFTDGRLALLRTKPILLVEVPVDGAELGPLEETADLPGEAVPIHAPLDERSRSSPLHAADEPWSEPWRERQRKAEQQLEAQRLEDERRADEARRAEEAHRAEEARRADEHARHVELVREREAAVLRADQERRAAEAEARRLAEEWQRAQEEAEARRRAAQEAWIQRRLLDAQRLDREAHPAHPAQLARPAPPPPPSIDELAMTTPRADREPVVRAPRAPLPPLAPPPVAPHLAGPPAGPAPTREQPATAQLASSPALTLQPARAGSGWSVRPPEPVPFDPRVTSERLELSEDDLVELDPEELSKEITLTNPLFRKPRGA